MKLLLNQIKQNKKSQTVTFFYSSKQLKLQGNFANGVGKFEDDFSSKFGFFLNFANGVGKFATGSGKIDTSL